MYFKIALALVPLVVSNLVLAKHHTTKKTTTKSSPTTGTTSSGGGSPSSSCAPGYYFPELSNFELQLPYGPGNKPLIITSSQLSGCNGYQNASWFYWDDAGKYIVMKAPPSDTNCAKTTNSLHCRTELRETNPASWSPKGTNTMTVDMTVAQADNGHYGTVIGQVFSAQFSKPVAELYYAPSGVITIGVEQTTSGGHENFTSVGNVPQGTNFKYELSYSNDDLTVSINGGAAQSFATSQLGNPNSYFKVGDYNQGTSVSSQVNLYSIDIVHQ